MKDEQQAGQVAQELIKSGLLVGGKVANKVRIVATKALWLALKKALLWLVALLGLPAILMMMLIFLLLGVYAVVASGDLNYSKTTLGEDDKEIAKLYFDVTDEMNRNADRDGFLRTKPPISQGSLEEYYYLDWEIVYSADLYEIQISNQGFNQKALQKAKVLRPYFSYEKSTVVTCYPCGDDGSTCCDIETVYLLKRADTYKATYTHYYERVSETVGEYTITYDKLNRIEELPETRWKRFDEALSLWYGESEQEAKEVARELTLQAAEGVRMQSPWLDWLATKDQYVQTIRDTWMAEIPPVYLEWFKDAAIKYASHFNEQGDPIIDWALLAAIAKIESSFNPLAIGSPNYTGELAQGIMQFLPSTWKKFGVDADGDSVANPFSPKDSIYAASNYLNYELGGDDETSLRKALFAYNRSNQYVDKVLQIANSLRWQEKFGHGKYTHPVKGCWVVSSGYGETRSTGSHSGTDFAGETGTPIVAAVGGEVIHTESGHRNYGSINQNVYGNVVWVRGHDGNIWIYAHLDSPGPVVSVGMNVAMGQVIGYLGNTGYSTGPHLHLEVRNGTGVGLKDPEQLLFGHRAYRGMKGCNS
ncbi:peptidoglycan DD-metalloendopeptidase family protein [Heliorestis convoluta]|uniref:Peptidoglycan DD-metalloendopeptidase family protein n=1 Tax=Heliorestis convoluta TaxID=356322 RepID=A0A5Q2MVV8_9FIRM|nr:peptidoglycan DD-metalloendopeptidase family protein [Heliorestis convoluta]QGG46348.1 peptidoglycan DD-metalloendopeptidase family protein [Heliorestis convoluta]